MTKPLALILVGCAAIAISSCVRVSAQKTETAIALAGAKSVFVGWIDISPDDWVARGYTSKQAWAKVIEGNNLVFQEACRARLKRRQVVGAKDRSEQNASAEDVRVQFLDVKFDPDWYWLYLSVRFLDPKSGAELASIPLEAYRGGKGCFTVKTCMRLAMEDVAKRVAEPFTKK